MAAHHVALLLTLSLSPSLSCAVCDLRNPQESEEQIDAGRSVVAKPRQVSSATASVQHRQRTRAGIQHPESAYRATQDLVGRGYGQEEQHRCENHFSFTAISSTLPPVPRADVTRARVSTVNNNQTWIRVTNSLAKKFIRESSPPLFERRQQEDRGFALSFVLRITKSKSKLYSSLPPAWSLVDPVVLNRRIRFISVIGNVARKPRAS